MPNPRVSTAFGVSTPIDDIARDDAIAFGIRPQVRAIAARVARTSDHFLEGDIMKVTKSASVVWTGGFKDGKGMISTESVSVRDVPYGPASRFEGGPGSNPEELIGAAHAACFTMALSLMLSESGMKAEQMRTQAEVTLEKQDQGFAITSSRLKLTARLGEADRAQFEQIAQKAKTNCPVSKLLKTEITLQIAFE